MACATLRYQTVSLRQPNLQYKHLRKMNLQKLQPRESLNKAFLKVKPNRNDIEHFKKNLQSLIEKINEVESEEFHKNLIGDFLKNTYYGGNHFINTKGRNDFVIHNGKDAKSSVGVILEAKKPTNKGEMLKVDNLNTKAFQELVLYFLRERLIEKNIEVKYLIVTNIYEWFIFDANSSDKAFIENKTLVKQFTDFAEGRLTSKKTDFFYKEIAQPAIAEIQDQIPFTYFDIREYQEYLQPGENPDDHKLIPLFKLFSPSHLLKLPFSNDSNTLDKGFYSELLHIIGLTETKEGGKKLIQRKKENERNPGSLIENAIVQLDSLDKISRIEKPERFGETYQEQIFNVGLELAITWVNRILFLKLLEAQLIKYHKNDPSFGFLNLEKVQNYYDLNSLFFSVLARKQEERTESLKKIFSHVPYLNSSLFEPTDMEQFTIFINNLRNEKLQIFPATVLKDNNGKKRIGEINALEYLFEFLNAYDFSSESGEEIQEENKRLINASVLGLIFEKINGYKDGSFFTPGFITMYMCRETIRRAVVQKFNEVKGWNCENIDDLYEKIEDKKEANTIINSLKICDPAVGSGHFLVSALNEIIAIKSELKILLDREGKRLKEYDIEVVNDELIVIDDEKLLFDYNPKSKESQRVQETLFHEKQTIIENCLFGVDINPNSVKICRLRLWIELLKNAYYRTSPLTPLLPGEGNIGELETLPNIDINIKCGNSLISRFSLDADLRQALNRNKCSMETYRNAVQTYRNAENKEQKREMERLINDIKGNFKTTLQGSDPNKTRFRKLEGELFNLENQILLFEETKAEKKTREKKISKLNNEIDKLRVEIEDIEGGKIYENALEWRFEFPEVLNNEGVFVGFDVVIGNPPYVPSKNLSEREKAIYYEKYKTTEYQINTFGIFSELGIKLLKFKGNLCLIIPNYWLATKYDKKLREFLFKENQTTDIINIYSIFESAVVETLLLFSNKESNNQALRIRSIDRDISTIDKRLDAVMFSNWSYDEKIVISNLDPELTLSFEDKIKINAESLIGNLFDLKFGAKLYEVGKGNPSQSQNDGKNKIYESELKIEESYIRLLRARNIQKYRLKIDDYYVKYGENLAAPRSISMFEGKRILIQRIVSKTTLDATYTNETMICNTDVITLKPKNNTINVKFYLAIICSKLCASVLKSQNVNLDRTAFPKINTETLSTFPVPEYKPEYINITAIVDQILTAKKSDPKADTTALETEIDQLVYQLYELTAEEIKIIEG
jgi:adenine-specific DNA-methyltransferase